MSRCGSRSAPTASRAVQPASPHFVNATATRYPFGTEALVRVARRRPSGSRIAATGPSTTAHTTPCAEDPIAPPAISGA
jgi:hypothetical protein